MQTTIYFISSSQNKYAEIRRLMGIGSGEPRIELLNHDAVEIQSLSSLEVVEAKIKSVMEQVKDRAILVEDTALHIGGEVGKNCPPGALIKFFMETLECIYASYVGKYAEAVCAIAYQIPDQEKPMLFEARVPGMFVSPRGSNGFGWDKQFQPQGSDKTFAEMTDEEKDKFSPRALVMQKLKDYLRSITNPSLSTSNS